MSGKKAIEHLYQHGANLFVHPFKVKWQVVPQGKAIAENQIVVQVGKRSYKRAVDRALMKRRIREAWRHCRPSLAGAAGEKNRLQLSIMIVGQELYAFEYLQKRLTLVVQKLVPLLAIASTATNTVPQEAKPESAQPAQTI